MKVCIKVWLQKRRENEEEGIKEEKFEK